MSTAPIRTFAEYENAVAELDRYRERSSPADTRLFAQLSLLIEDYERRHWPVDPPRVLEAVRHRMHTGRFTAAALGRAIGTRALASDVLSGKRALDLRMVRALHAAWNIPMESMVGPAEVEAR